MGAYSHLLDGRNYFTHNLDIYATDTYGLGKFKSFTFGDNDILEL